MCSLVCGGATVHRYNESSEMYGGCWPGWLVITRCCSSSRAGRRMLHCYTIGDADSQSAAVVLPPRYRCNSVVCSQPVSEPLGRISFPLCRVEEACNHFNHGLLLFVIACILLIFHHGNEEEGEKQSILFYAVVHLHLIAHAAFSNNVHVGPWRRRTQRTVAAHPGRGKQQQGWSVQSGHCDQRIFRQIL